MATDPPSSSAPEANPSHRMKCRPSILLLGDSLTQLSFEGWGATLANVYQRRCDVLNRGYSGYNTKYYVQHVLPQLMRDDLSETSNVKLCIIFFGANDAALQEVDPHHHVPVDEYVELLKTIVTQLQQTPSRPHILLVTPPPVHHGQRLQYQKQRYGDNATGVLERRNDVTSQYADACALLGNQLNVPVLHLYDAMVKNGNECINEESSSSSSEDGWAEYFYDGLHFSAVGHAFVAQQLLTAINEHFPALAVIPDPSTKQWCNSGSKCTGLTSQGPYHDEIK